ncbi:MAG: glycosyltransferase family 2 protein [Paramuribaculum sp.]|nr:glycosyltransferase family 2 protein [Paramuribaculum sp.]
MNKKPVGVIILNWNGEKLLRDYLHSVVEYTSSEIADVIVADNGSSDNSREFVSDNFPTVKLLTFNENLGFAEGYNRALKETDYEFTVLLNSDVEVKSDWLTPLYSFMNTHPEAGACQPKILSIREPERFEYAGAGGGLLDRWGYPYCRGRIMSKIETDTGQYDDTARVFWASGAALMVRNKAYFAVGGLDPSFFAHQEEIDLCWRMQLSGYQIYAVGSSAVYHLGGGSLHTSDPRKTYLNFRNNLLMLHKNLPAEKRGKRIFIRRMIDTLAWIKYILTFDFSNAQALLKAHRDYSRMKKGYPKREGETPDLLRLAPNRNKSIFFLKA